MWIGELAQRTGVSPRSLRYYERHGLIEARRSAGDWREFDEPAVQRVRNIAALLRRGLTIDGIKQLEPCLSQSDFLACDDPAEAIETYESRLAVIDGRLAKLSDQRDQLAGGLRELRAHRT